MKTEANVLLIRKKCAYVIMVALLLCFQSSLIPTPQCQTRQGKWGAFSVELSNQMISVSNLGPCDAVCGSDLYTKNFLHIYASLPCPD